MKHVYYTKKSHSGQHHKPFLSEFMESQGVEMCESRHARSKPKVKKPININNFGSNRNDMKRNKKSLPRQLRNIRPDVDLNYHKDFHRYLAKNQFVQLIESRNPKYNR